VYMMEFGEVRLSVVEAIWRCRSSKKNPLAKDRWVRQLQPSLRIINNQRRLLRLSSSGSRLNEDKACRDQADSSNNYIHKLYKLFHLQLSFYAAFSSTKV